MKQKLKGTVITAHDLLIAFGWVFALTLLVGAFLAREKRNREYLQLTEQVLELKKELRECPAPDTVLGTKKK